MIEKQKVEKLFVRLAPALLTVAGIFLAIALYQMGVTNVRVSETAAYTRVTNCVVTKVANAPTTQYDIELCHVQVEKATGIDLERFDKQKAGDNTENK